MGLSTSVLTAIHGGASELSTLAALLEREKRAIVKAAQVLKRRGLLEIVPANAFDKAFDAEIPATQYTLTEAGRQQAASGLPVNPGQGERPRKKTVGLRERAWWELRKYRPTSLDQVTSTHAEGTEKAADINIYKYLVALERAGLLLRLSKKAPARQSQGRVLWQLNKERDARTGEAIAYGPRAPVWRQRAREVYDPNTGKVYPLKSAAECALAGAVAGAQAVVAAGGGHE